MGWTGNPSLLAQQLLVNPSQLGFTVMIEGLPLSISPHA
jgi:hypothetical protein